MSVPSEAQEHRALAAWLWLVEARTPGFWWTTIPLGGGGYVRGGILKAAGARKGTPDVLLLYRDRAQFIEIKRRRKGWVTPDQRACHQAIVAAGGYVFVAYGWESAKAFVEQWLAEGGR